YTPEVGALTPECDDPARLPALVDQALADPEQMKFRPMREAHMKKWLCNVDGRAAERVATEIAQALATRKRPKRIETGFSDMRRGAKLRLARFFGEPVHVTPQVFFRRIFRGEKGKQTMRYRDYMKSIRPADERHAREQIAPVEGSSKR